MLDCVFETVELVGVVFKPDDAELVHWGGRLAKNVLEWKFEKSCFILVQGYRLIFEFNLNFTNVEDHESEER